MPSSSSLADSLGGGGVGGQDASASASASTIALPQPPDEQAADAELVRRARRGDSEAATLLVQRYQTIIYATALRRVKRVDIAQDLTQETFLTALDHLARLREPDRLRSWLFGILRNHIREAARRHVRRPHSLNERIDEEQRLLDRRSGTSMNVDENRPAAALEADELSKMLRSALETIPERYRDVLVLRYLQGWGVPDIAEHLGCSIPAVEVALHRARKALGERATKSFKDLAL